MHSRPKLCLFAIACLSGAAQAAREDATDLYFESTHIIGAGMAYQAADAELRATAEGLPPVKVDLNNLGVDDKGWSGAFEYRWRFAPRWELTALAYRFDESGDQTVQRDFNFDGQDFTAGLAVDTSMKIDTYIVDVLYSVYRRENLDIMLGGGLHAFDLEASIRAKAFIDDETRRGEAASSDLLAPLPNLRFQAFYKITESWRASLVAGWLSANYDDYDGGFAYLHPRIGYLFGDHWAVSLGYQWVDIDLTYERSSNRETEFDAEFRGPTVFLNYRF